MKCVENYRYYVDYIFEDDKKYIVELATIDEPVCKVLGSIGYKRYIVKEITFNGEVHMLDPVYNNEIHYYISDYNNYDVCTINLDNYCVMEAREFYELVGIILGMITTKKFKVKDDVEVSRDLITNDRIYNANYYLTNKGNIFYKDSFVFDKNEDKDLCIDYLSYDFDVLLDRIKPLINEYKALIYVLSDYGRIPLSSSLSNYSSSRILSL